MRLNKLLHRQNPMIKPGWLVPCAHIGTAEMYLSLIIEAEGADVAITVKHMLVLVTTALKPASHNTSFLSAECVS